MVDTLAPKKTMTQRELDSKLTPIAEKVKEGPLVTGEIVKDYLCKPLPLLKDESNSPATKTDVVPAISPIVLTTGKIPLSSRI